MADRPKLPLRSPPKGGMAGPAIKAGPWIPTRPTLPLELLRPPVVPPAAASRTSVPEEIEEVPSTQDAALLLSGKRCKECNARVVSETPTCISCNATYCKPCAKKHYEGCKCDGCETFYCFACRGKLSGPCRKCKHAYCATCVERNPEDRLCDSSTTKHGSVREMCGACTRKRAAKRSKSEKTFEEVAGQVDEMLGRKRARRSPSPLDRYV